MTPKQNATLSRVRIVRCDSHDVVRCCSRAVTLALNFLSSFSAMARRSPSVPLLRLPPSLTSPVASSTTSVPGEKSGSQGRSFGDLGASALRARAQCACQRDGPGLRQRHAGGGAPEVGGRFGEDFACSVLETVAVDLELALEEVQARVEEGLEHVWQKQDRAAPPQTQHDNRWSLSQGE